MKKKLIATDYDGTLRRLGVITKKDRKYIELFRKKGGLFGVVTGRGSDFPKTAAEDGITCDFFILCNGSLILDKDGNLIKEFLIPRDIFVSLEKKFETYEGLRSYSKANDSEFYHHYYSRCDSVEQARQIADEINKEFGDKVTAFVNGDNVNIGLKGSSKAEGVRIAAEYFGLTQEDCAVVGDDYNDLDMIVSLHGWAMKTGRREVRKAAEHLTSSVGALAKELMEM